MNTWPHALAALLVLLGTAAALQRAAPNDHTFAAALKTVMHRR
jgi:hypothetical protein